MPRDDIAQIGMTYGVLSREGVYDLKTIAKEYYDQQSELDKQKKWSHDRYLKHSSNAVGQVSSPNDSDFRDCSVWSINHYLGLNRHPYVISKAKEVLDKYGTGCGTSAMSGGHCQLHKDLQKRLAKIFSKEDALLFSTGFTANSGAISALCKGSETFILIDRESHASIIEGCKTSGSSFLPFKHNNLEDLEKKLKRYCGKYVNILVITESVYSMEGDIAPLKEIVALKKKYNFLLYVDEAHSFGFYGEKGAGVCNQLGIAQDVDFIMTTLSKSTASIGGVIATSKEFASFLRWSNAYLFQAAIPPVDAAVVDACLDLISNDDNIIKSLWQKTKYLRDKLLELGFDVGESSSPIVPVYIRDMQTLKQVEKELFDSRIFVIAIYYPAVHKNAGRLRLIVNNSHEKKDLDDLIAALNKLGKKYKFTSLPHDERNCTNNSAIHIITDRSKQHT